MTDALQAARTAAGSGDLVYVGGSMYVLAELLTAIGYDDKLDSLGPTLTAQSQPAQPLPGIVRAFVLHPGNMTHGW